MEFSKNYTRDYDATNAICWYSEIIMNPNRSYYIIVEDNSLVETYKDLFKQLNLKKEIIVYSSMDNGKGGKARREESGKEWMQKDFNDNLFEKKFKNFVLLFDRDYDHLIGDQFYKEFNNNNNVVYLDKYCFENYFVSNYYLERSIARMLNLNDDEAGLKINYNQWIHNVISEYARILPAQIALRSNKKESLITKKAEEIFDFVSSYTIRLKPEYEQIINPEHWCDELKTECFKNFQSIKMDIDMKLSRKKYDDLASLIPGKQLLTIYLQLWKYSFNTHLSCNNYSTCSHTKCKNNPKCQNQVHEGYTPTNHMKKTVIDNILFSTELKAVCDKITSKFS